MSASDDRGPKTQAFVPKDPAAAAGSPAKPKGPPPVPGTQAFVPKGPPPTGGTQAFVPKAPPPTGGTQAFVPKGPPPASGTQAWVPPHATPVRGTPAAVLGPGVDEAPSGDEPKPGDRVRQYELIRRLGRGGMGEVFLARDTKLGRRVAIKFLHTQDPTLVERFVVEARATARCGHENIVTLYEADTFHGRPYMALEFLQGNTLATLLEDGNPVPPSRAVELMVPVLRALVRAHAEGIVHRDLKPENVMLTDAGVIKVLDFGIAKVAGAVEPRAQEPRPGEAFAPSQDPGLTGHGMTLGTLQYMSPEQWRGEAIDHRTDLWAVGVMLFRMITGHHPLAGLEGMELSRVADPAEAMPSLRGPGIPDGLVQAVDACLQKDREQRPPDALALLSVLEPFMPGRIERGLRLDESPYAGLSAFQEADADRFFGRTHEIAALVTRLRDRPVMAVVGPSGIGKSSFVRAGVVPALKRLGESWETVVLRPGRTPLAALASALAASGATTGSGAAKGEVNEERDLLERLAHEPGYAGALLRAWARQKSRRVLVTIDQFEELYTLVSDPRERIAFTTCLAGMADDATSPVRVVLCVRSDFLERVSEDPRFMAELSQGLFFLSRPGDEGLRDALTLPAEMAGFRFESPQMVEDLVHDVRSTKGALPLLQFAATQLWEARDRARKVLTRASYDQLGGISGALAHYADRVLEELPPKARTAAREVFLRLVTPERTRAIVSVDELLELGGGAEVDQLVEQLAGSRLLVIERSDRGSTAEIVHESLIHGWPTLRRWLDESGEDAELLEQIRTGAKQWDANGRRTDLLWRGELAEEARRFRRRYRGNLTEAQRAFVEAVLANAARVARRRRALVMAGIGALLVIVVGSLVAVVVIRNAQKEAERQAQIARVAETEAKQRAADLAVKERERAAAAQKAEEEARRAEEEARKAEAASQELALKNDQLAGALSNAEAARARATAARLRAEESAAAARLAREEADRAAKQLAVRLDEEKERVRRLQDQFGSPMADALPR